MRIHGVPIHFDLLPFLCHLLPGLGRWRKKCIRPGLHSLVPFSLSSTEPFSSLEPFIRPMYASRKVLMFSWQVDESKPLPWSTDPN